MSPEPRHIVIDTNVLLSAGLLPHSVPARALTLALEQFVLAQDQATWQELQTRIARPKFDRYFGESGRLAHLTQLARSAAFFETGAAMAVCRDPDDDKFLALALVAQAQVIVTGDQDLRMLHPFQGVDICTPAEFLLRYQAGPR